MGQLQAHVFVGRDVLSAGQAWLAVSPGCDLGGLPLGTYRLLRGLRWLGPTVRDVASL